MTRRFPKQVTLTLGLLFASGNVLADDNFNHCPPSPLTCSTDSFKTLCQDKTGRYMSNLGWQHGNFVLLQSGAYPPVGKSTLYFYQVNINNKHTGACFYEDAKGTYALVFVGFGYFTADKATSSAKWQPYGPHNWLTCISADPSQCAMTHSMNPPNSGRGGGGRPHPFSPR